MKKIIYCFTLLCSFFYSQNAFSKINDEFNEAALTTNPASLERIENNDLEVILPAVIFTFNETEIKLKFKNANHSKLALNQNKIDFIINGQDQILTFVNGEASFKHRFDADKKLSIYTDNFGYTNSVTAYPLWLFFIPVGFMLGWFIVKRMKK
jgi:hypothetical protein